MTDEEEKVLSSTVDEIEKTIECTKYFTVGVKEVLRRYRVLVHELRTEVNTHRTEAYQLSNLNAVLNDEVRALKYDVEQRDKALAEMEYIRSSDVKHDKFVRGELKNQIHSSEVEILKLKDSVRLWGGLFAVSVCVSFFLLIALIEGVLS